MALSNGLHRPLAPDRVRTVKATYDPGTPACCGLHHRGPVVTIQTERAVRLDLVPVVVLPREGEPAHVLKRVDPAAIEDVHQIRVIPTQLLVPIAIGMGARGPAPLTRGGYKPPVGNLSG